MTETLFADKMEHRTKTENLTIEMSSAEDEIDYGEHVELKYGLYVMFSSVLFFQCLNWLVAYWGTPKRVTVDSWKWRNLFISWFHALIVGPWDLLCFYFYPELVQELFLYQRYFIYYMSSFTTGYFIYDFMDMILNHKCRKMWEVTLHHIAVTSGFLYIVLSRFAMSYHVVATMAEINSFFLHSRKLLQWHQIGYDHWLYRLTCWLNIITFFFCRGISLGSQVIGLFILGHRATAFLYYLITADMIIMVPINVIFFGRLLKADFIRRETRKSEEYMKVNGNNNIKDFKQH